jgi:hypothetical protein
LTVFSGAASSASNLGAVVAAILISAVVSAAVAFLVTRRTSAHGGQHGASAPAPAGRSVPRTGAWLVVAILLVIVAFAVLQPFLWQWFFPHRTPPTDSAAQDLGTLVGVVLTIMSLAIASVGVLGYNLLVQHTNALIDKSKTDLAAAVVDARRELEPRVLLARLVSKYAVGMTRMAMSYNAWRDYDQLWRDSGWGKDWHDDKQDEFTDLLEYVIAENEDGFKAFREVTEALAGHPDLERMLGEDPQLTGELHGASLSSQISGGNLAYHLAVRRAPGDCQRARELLADWTLPRAGENANAWETVAWVRLRCTETPGRGEDWELGCRAYEMFATFCTSDHEKETVRQRYAALFGDGPWHRVHPSIS